MDNIHFWNGNKSSARKDYEAELLESCLNATVQEYGFSKIRIDETDYPLAEDEGDILETGSDILVTVAGNVKFRDKQKIMISQPLAKGILGHRLILVRDESLARFGQLESAQALQALSFGVPKTWADAEMFRRNNYRVVEKGSLDDLFVRLKNQSFDYTALGANEIEATFNELAAPLGGISIEPSVMLYYPLPLVFYVNPGNSVLAERVQAGLRAIMDSGQYEALFSKHHGDVLRRLDLNQRTIFTLQNPFLPKEMANFRSTLLD